MAMASNNPEVRVIDCGERCKGAITDLCQNHMMGSAVDEAVVKELIGSEEKLGDLSMRQVALDSCRGKLARELKKLRCQLTPEQVDYNVNIFREELKLD